nr:serine/threonine protein kinase [Geodermatophilaceae bacterium]
MPYYPAGSLAGRLSGTGPLPWAEVAAIGVRMSGALQTAHDAGILHRDIKPANILLDEYGGTRLADFGQARLADSELTRTGEMTLTPGYAAPEMLEGGAASAQSDIYSLAVTLAALVIGGSPFANDDVDLVGLLYRVVHTSPPDLRPAGVPDVLPRCSSGAWPSGRRSAIPRWRRSARRCSRYSAGSGSRSPPWWSPGGPPPPCRRCRWWPPTRRFRGWPRH